MSRNRNNSPTRTAIIDVVVTFGGRFDCLETCLNALYREAKQNPISVILVDNASPAEEKLEHLELFQTYPKDLVSFKTKRLTPVRGFPEMANDGAREGKAPLIMFLSDDVELAEGALDKVIRRMDDPQIGVVGIKLLFPLNSTNPGRPAGKVQHVGHSMNIRGEVIHPLLGWSADNPKCCKSQEVWSVTGACFTVRRSLFNKIGGFNMVYGKGYFEDCELCMAVHQAGQKVFVDCDAIGYHYTGATMEKFQLPAPLMENLMTFRSRWQKSGLLQWRELDFW
jgi:GT2 family glycosyltransferase